MPKNYTMIKIKLFKYKYITYDMMMFYYNRNVLYARLNLTHILTWNSSKEERERIEFKFELHFYLTKHLTRDTIAANWCVNAASNEMTDRS